MKRIKRFGVVQTATVFAAIYFLLSGLFMIPVGFISLLGGSSASGIFPFFGIMFLLAPFLYGILGFVAVAIGCLIYNLTAGITGGIEVEFDS